MGTVLYERNELEEAALSSELSVKWSELGGFAENRIPAYYCLAQKLLAKGELARAEEEMKKGDEASRHPTVSPVSKAWHLADRVLLAIQQDDTDAAREWGRQLSGYPLDTLWTWLQHARARLAIALGDVSSAREQLGRLYEKAIQADALGYAIRLRVYQALAAATPEEAMAFLGDALKMGEPEGFIRTFVDEGKLLRPLLARAVTKGVSAPYASKLIGIIDAEEAIRKAGMPGKPQAGVLSERELEILRLIAAGLSNRQIAARLVITLNTAKTHVHNISQKLEVSTRTQAIARARELKLI